MLDGFNHKKIVRHIPHDGRPPIFRQRLYTVYIDSILILNTKLTSKTLMAIASSFPLRHPERVHPALWRGTQLARPQGAVVSTGFHVLDRQLPGQGWPLSSLIELMPSQPGIGELQLLRPALARLDARSILLIGPPYSPHYHCWRNWGLEKHRLIWINPQTQMDVLWAAEQALRHHACAALLCWAEAARLPSLRRLHWAAAQNDALFVMLRPPCAANQASPASLRLSLSPAAQGMKVHILKRRGPACNASISIPFYLSQETEPTASAPAAGHLYAIPAAGGTTHKHRLPGQGGFSTARHIAAHHVTLDQPVSANA